MNTDTQENLEFAVCINNDGYAASLEVGKLYPAIPDGEGVAQDYMRIIEESGEDYAFEAGRFSCRECFACCPEGPGFGVEEKIVGCKGF